MITPGSPRSQASTPRQDKAHPDSSETENESREHLLRWLQETRELSLELCAPLEPEDYRIQSMADVSPPWWNLGHTTWFFAKNILQRHTEYEFKSAGMEYVLNSYYETHGQRVPRHERGHQSRPTTSEVLAFRRDVDEEMARLIESIPSEELPGLTFLVTTGIQHEQQHQELLITEIKHILGQNAPSLRGVYNQATPVLPQASGSSTWARFGGGLFDFGNADGDWCWDNELPVHQAFVAPFELASRMVTVRDYLEFMADGGYSSPLLWMANGWAQVQQREWRAPLYWERDGDDWAAWTLNGLCPLNPDEPVAHVSFYEADAFANWRGQIEGDRGAIRLPTEREWELACRQTPDAPTGTFLDSRSFHPAPAQARGMSQLLGDLWEWTTSHYEPYPGYRPFEGDLLEYNSKFMDNQRVLRGGSCATPRDHIRPSYRNFWPADTRFQFSGFRLARSL